MIRSHKNYSDKEVKKDVELFFRDDSHWVYEYGGPSSCNIDSPYHRKQMEVLFEDRYWHWVTDRAINSLLEEGFLREEVRTWGNVPIKFVYRYNIRRIKRGINERVKLIRRYSDPVVTKAVGGYAEMLFSFMFRVHNFNVVGRNVNEYGGVVWKKTNHDMDFIIEKDNIAYGVEVKNTLPYIERDEFNVKLEMCRKLNLIPLFVLRGAPGVQFDEVSKAGGFILMFKTQMYPPGQENLVRDVWDFMRLPVNVVKEIYPKLERIFVHEHEKRV